MSICKSLMGAISVVIYVVASSPASAQRVGDWYIRGDAGWSGSVNANIHDQNFPVDHVITDANGNAGNLSDINSGWLVGVGLGTWFAPDFRADLVYTYRGDYRLDQNDEAVPPNNFNGHISSNSVMANVYGDIPIDTPGVVPFLGLGIGWANVHMSNLSGTGSLVVTPLAGISSTATALAPGGTQDNFAWQVTAGVGFPLSRDAIVDIFYRYFDGGHMRSEAGNVTVDGTVIRTYSGAEGAFHAHEFGVSLRFPIGG